MLQVEASTFAAALARVLPAIPRHPTLPVLSGVRLTAKDGTLTVCASSLDVTARVRVPAQGDELDVVVPGKITAAFAGKCSGALGLGVVDADLVIEAPRTRGRFRTYPAADWPRLVDPVAEPVTIPAATVAVVRRVLHAAAVDFAGRPILTGVFFAGVQVVATDSFRLAVADLDVTVPELLIPAAGLKAALGDTDVAICAGDNRLASFDDGTSTWTFRCIPGEYPNYKQLIAVASAHTLTIERLPFLDALDIVSPTIESALLQPVVDLTCAGAKLVVGTSRQDVGAITREVDCDGPDDFSVSFNARFLRDTLDACTGDEVTFELDTPLKPAQVRDGALLQMLMPVKRT